MQLAVSSTSIDSSSAAVVSNSRLPRSTVLLLLSTFQRHQIPNSALSRTGTIDRKSTHMPLVGRGALILCTSSSLLFIHTCAYYSRHVFRGNRGAITGSSLAQVFKQDCRMLSTSPFRRVPTSMGPVHGSAYFQQKIKSIGAVLRKDHGHMPADGLQVIMDFDLTMTAPGSEQCHHMFETSSALSAELRGRLAPYFTPSVQFSSREEWWDGFHAVLVDAGLTREQVGSVARGADVTLREGTTELMLLLQERGVPLLIVSAGISDIVEETLRSHTLLLDNVTVRANTMRFGEDGKLASFRESPPVHSRNKRQTARREKAYFAAHRARRCMVVVGDKPGDADVNYGIVPDEHCVKIGFFDHSHEHPHPDLPPLPPRATSTPSASDGPNGSCDSKQIRVSANVIGVVPQAKTSPNCPNESPPPERNGVKERIELVGDKVSFLEYTVEVGATHVAPVESISSKERIAGKLVAGDQDGGAISVSSATTATTTTSMSTLAMDDLVETLISTSAVNVDGEDSLALRGSEDRDGASLDGGGVAVAVEDMLLTYGESFDVVARGGHSMDIVADLVRRLIGELDSEK